ncbi:STY0301 family protein [Herbaspirillum sp. SJZ107]|uniref:STY0301 family protein n=1 Tax=Herbaspirillum sp. SJZ107 TaxID=2572881 RepID=UPI0011528FE1|nr:STY0301 family protein [Herbaspirillum sp. SJZ107]TQK10268.1 hypothetical protein FBX97_0184 [Herbaspirillum sp. SJZ107]
MRRLFILAATLPSLAATQTISCPAIITEGSIQVQRAPEGWQASASTPVWLDGGGMLSGAPAEMRYLVQASSKKAKGATISTWNFQPGEEKWLYCTYGKMAVQLSRRMDDRATVCEVTATTSSKGSVTSITAACR